MSEQNREIVAINEDTIKNKIYYIRNQKVMLDFELAEIYGVPDFMSCHATDFFACR